jgi:prefoldin beta subunit
MKNDQKIQELSALQQNIASTSAQKQQFAVQLNEYDSALKQIDKTEKTYKIIGNIMVSSDKDSLKEDLNNKKEMLNIRIKSLEKQEQQLKDKAEQMQKEVMKSIEEK